MADSRNIDDLDPAVQRLCREHMRLANKAGLNPLLTATRRTLAESRRLYAQGRTTPGKIVTNAKAGDSFHNYGLAWDAYPRIDGNILWSYDRSKVHIQAWDEFMAIANKLGGITLGHHFRLVDTAHFQVDCGKPISFFRNGGKPFLNADGKVMA